MAGTTEQRIAQARGTERFFVREVGRSIPAERYPEVVAVWNKAIGVKYGRPFDPSHDRERGSSG